MPSAISKKQRLAAVVPLIFSMAAFALALVSLFAGYKPGQLEDFHIISVGPPHGSSVRGQGGRRLTRTGRSTCPTLATT